MTIRGATESPIRAGDVDGLGRVYSEYGGPVLGSHETVLVQRKGCDIAAYGSWRIFFPKEIFYPLPGNPSGTFYVTSDRLIFLRDIDIWKEVKPLLTPLGLPAAAEKESKLKSLKAKGSRQYCEVFPSQLRLMQVKRKSGLMRLRLVAEDRRRYELIIYTDKNDPVFFDLIERKMRQPVPRT